MRRKVISVPKQIDLFKGSLLENIALGEFEPDMNEIFNLIDIFHFSEFIAGLPNGLESYVAEKGINFSGGEKQKIGLMRAFYKKPSIVLLDETTSELDRISERKVLKALKKFSNDGITILIVTHRIEVMKMADSIAFLHNGKIMEEGSYQNLITKKGSFYNFVNY